MKEAKLARYFDHEKKEGVVINSNNIQKIDFILIRNDGWSIGCSSEDLAEIKSYYEKEWIMIMVVSSSSSNFRRREIST